MRPRWNLSSWPWQIQLDSITSNHSSMSNNKALVFYSFPPEIISKHFIFLFIYFWLPFSIYSLLFMPSFILSALSKLYKLEFSMRPIFIASFRFSILSVSVSVSMFVCVLVYGVTRKRVEEEWKIAYTCINGSSTNRITRFRPFFFNISECFSLIRCPVLLLFRQLCFSLGRFFFPFHFSH